VSVALLFDGDVPLLVRASGVVGDIGHPFAEVVKFFVCDAQGLGARWSFFESFLD
jgi:hypothetical protein